MRVALLTSIFVLACAGCHGNAEPRNVSAGPSPNIAGNHETVELGAGTYEGDLVIGGNHNVVRGVGYDKTIIKGRLLISGNHNTVSSMTVENGGTIEGNHNDATKVEFHGDVTTGGHKNTK